MSAAQPTVVRINGLPDLAAAVPHLLGFRPTESLVAVAVRGPRQRLGFSMRLDLVDPCHDEEIAGETAVRMRYAGADEVLLFVVTDAPRADGLPRRELVDAVAVALPVPLLDAALVADGRVWSYLCADPRCCPAAGHEVRPGSSGAVALAAAHALAGHAVLPDREAVVATTRRVTGVAARSMHQALDRAWAALDADRPVEDLRAESVARVEQLCSRLSEPRSDVSHDEAADIVVRLHDVLFRDELIGRLARDDEPLERLVERVARLAQPPDDAPAAALLAVASYLRGRGVVASAAAERALGTDPAYSLARLVLDALHAQVEPRRLRELWRTPPPRTSNLA
jgi:hypothetical protein